jgi:hypothetical protein
MLSFILGWLFDAYKDLTSNRLRNLETRLTNLEKQRSMESKMLKDIKEYFANTPKEQIDKDWQEIEAMGFTSPTVDEFIENQKKHEIMTQETQLEKAIVIAVKDGFEKLNEEQFYRKDSHYLSPANLYILYTTDLNYLMPICSKVHKELNNVFTQESTMAQKRIFISMLNLNQNDGQYTELFNACYEAVKLLENE